MTREKDLTRFNDEKSEKEYVKAEVPPSSCAAEEFLLHHDAEATIGFIGLRRKDGKREGEGKGGQGRSSSAAPPSKKVGMVFKAAAAPPVLTLPSLPSGFICAKPRRSSAEETKAAPQCLTEGLTRPTAMLFGDEYWSSALSFLLACIWTRLCSACVVAGQNLSARVFIS
uniref:Uncharacterized protein n=1 Tax=Echinococcus granulosus TaxID=6210 RepID=A0A068WXN3_ECHGR|nr:hypothetical protein EgrG_000731200 [Echinococcus granulosus]